MLWPLYTFDDAAEVAIVERKLPHWSQAGCLCFMTWRTADSMPQSVLSRWYADRDLWLRKQGIPPEADDWRQQLLLLERPLQVQFVKTFSERWHRSLDAGHGECRLRDSANSLIVAHSLQHFNGDRYRLTDFIVMPNHVHVMAAFPNEEGMLAQCESWKHFTAHEINQNANREGRFWQQDGFDHLVRTIDQFHAIRKYILDNPAKARLSPEDCRHFSAAVGPAS